LIYWAIVLLIEWGFRLIRGHYAKMMA
jgi:L-cystine transport system permease protein